MIFRFYSQRITLKFLKFGESEIVLKTRLGIIRDKNNPYKWINAYTQEEIKFEYLSSFEPFLLYNNSDLTFLIALSFFECNLL